MSEWWVAHLVQDNVYNESEEFYGPFESDEQLEALLDKRRICGGKWRNMPNIVKIMQLDSSHTKDYKRLDDSCGYIYENVYYGPFTNQHVMFKAIVEVDNEKLSNNLKIFEMWTPKY